MIWFDLFGMLFLLIAVVTKVKNEKENNGIERQFNEELI